MAYPRHRTIKPKYRDNPTKPKVTDPNNLFDSINDEESEEIDIGSNGDAELDENHYLTKGVRPSDGFDNWEKEEE